VKESRGTKKTARIRIRHLSLGLIAMKLRLYVSIKDDMRDYSHRHHIRFAVIDLAKSKKYPANFICVLPQQPSANGKPSNVFSKVFGKDSVELAKRLLTKALKNEEDSEIKAEIENRLKLLEPKPAVQVKCRVCGNFFETERRRFKQKICQECRRKKHVSQE
jgi:hypothetical protein